MAKIHDRCFSRPDPSIRKPILYLPTLILWAWVSHLRVESFDLTPAHTCGPISHAWLKNVSCCCLAWHNFQKYVNSDPCKERKPCVKWINDNTFLAISDFWSEKHWERAHVYTHPKTLTGTSDVFGRPQTSSEDFWILRESSEMIVSSSKIPALPGQKSHAYISEKVGRYTIHPPPLVCQMFLGFTRGMQTSSHQAIIKFWMPQPQPQDSRKCLPVAF